MILYADKKCNRKGEQIYGTGTCIFKTGDIEKYLEICRAYHCHDGIYVVLHNG
jgi:hypothetical protein